MLRKAKKEHTLSVTEDGTSLIIIVVRGSGSMFGFTIVLSSLTTTDSEDWSACTIREGSVVNLDTTGSWMRSDNLIKSLEFINEIRYASWERFSEERRYSICLRIAVRSTSKEDLLIKKETSCMQV